MTYLFTLPISIALLLCALLVEAGTGPGSDELFVIRIALMACIGMLLFVSQTQPKSTSTFVYSLISAAIVTVMFVVVVLVTRDHTISFAAMARVTMTCFLLLTLGVLLLTATSGRTESNRQFIAIGFVAFSTAPVWLAPLAEATGNVPWLTNAIVGLSPLSALAVALDFDILRSNWFYEHSAIGSMRYAYPASNTYLIILLVLSSIAALPHTLLRRNRARNL